MLGGSFPFAPRSFRSYGRSHLSRAAKPLVTTLDRMPGRPGHNRPPGGKGPQLHSGASLRGFRFLPLLWHPSGRRDVLAASCGASEPYWMGLVPSGLAPLTSEDQSSGNSPSEKSDSDLPPTDIYRNVERIRITDIYTG